MQHVDTAAKANQLSWTVAQSLVGMPRGTVFAASYCAIAGVRLAQDCFGSKLALCGRGGAYDPSGILSLHARHWLFNRHPRAHIGLLEVFDTLSEAHALLTSPGQVDSAGSANLSVVGPHERPRVSFGGTRGLPDARSIHFVLPNHNPRQLVQRVDFVSTSVKSRATSALLITDLAVMRWDARAEMWNLESLVAGVEVDDVQSRTGFKFNVAAAVQRVGVPGADVLERLEQVDPLGLRHLDYIFDRNEQLDAISRIYQREAELVGRSVVPPRGGGLSVPIV